MTLSDKHILEFQALYKKHFGIEITKEQALDKGLRLIRLLKSVSSYVVSSSRSSQSVIDNPNRVP
jgi:hypothetical protein